MFIVIYTTNLNKDLKSLSVQLRVFKKYKTKKQALISAWTRNQMISQQSFGNHYYVFDQQNKIFLAAEAG